MSRTLKRITITIGVAAVIFACRISGQEEEQHDHKHGTSAHADHAGHEGETVGEVGHDDHAGHDAEAGSGHDPDHGHEHGSDEHAEHVDEVTLSAEAIEQYGLKVEPVWRRNLADLFAAPAQIAYNTEAMAHVGTPVGGRVTEIRVRLGDAVAKGDVLSVIDSPALGEAQSDFLQKRTAVQVARTSLEVSQTAYERSKSLLEGKGLSLGEFQRREGEYKMAQVNLLSAESAALAAENKLHIHGMTQEAVEELIRSGEIDARYFVRAQIAGRVIEREATLGEVVGPEREALMILADLSILWVLADVPESRIARLSIGSPARVAVGALSGEVFTGSVSYIAPQLNSGTRTAQARIEIAGGESGLRPGMFGQVELLAGDDDATTATQLAVPESAVLNVEGGPAVFVPVAGEENTFARRAVKVAPRVGNFVPILSGLTEGERVVTGGAFILKADLGKAGAAHEH